MKKNGKFTILLALQMVFLLICFAACTEDETPVAAGFSIEGQSTEEISDSLFLDLSVPVLSGFDAAGVINKQIEEIISRAKAETEDAAELLYHSSPSKRASLHSNYLYSKSDDLVSLWLMMDNYLGGAHGLYWVETFTFNPSTNEIYRFYDLFREGNASAGLITESILKRIKDHSEYYFPSAAETVKTYQNDYPYYINGNKLIVYFPLYDIAPYAGGIRFFDFTADELKNILKPEIYDAMKSGTPVDTKGTILEHNTEK